MKRILCIVLVVMFCLSPLLAEANSLDIQEDSLARANAEISRLGKGIGIGLAVSGIAAGIGVIGSAAAEGIARQPEASESIMRAMNTGVYACVGIAALAVAATYFF